MGVAGCVAGGVLTNTSLVALYLDHNALREGGGVAIADALERNC